MDSMLRPGCQIRVDLPRAPHVDIERDTKAVAGELDVGPDGAARDLPHAPEAAAAEVHAGADGPIERGDPLPGEACRSAHWGFPTAGPGRRPGPSVAVYEEEDRDSRRSAKGTCFFKLL